MESAVFYRSPPKVVSLLCLSIHLTYDFLTNLFLVKVLDGKEFKKRFVGPWTIQHWLVNLVCNGTFHGQLGIYPVPVLAIFNLLKATFIQSHFVSWHNGSMRSQTGKCWWLRGSRITILAYASTSMYIHYCGINQLYVIFWTEIDQPSRVSTLTEWMMVLEYLVWA